MTKTPDSTPKLFNATPELAAAFVECMKRYQDLGRDLEVLQAFLMDYIRNREVGARALACIVTASSLVQAVCNVQIHAMTQDDDK